jgi:hypothetical protein
MRRLSMQEWKRDAVSEVAQCGVGKRYHRTYNLESLSVLFLSKCFLTETAFLMRW